MKKPLTLERVWSVLFSIWALAWIAVVLLRVPNPYIWGLSVMLVTAVAAAMISMRYPRTIKLNRFIGRDMLADEQIYERFYATSGIPREKVLREWHHVSRLLEIPAGLMRPTDRFDDELSPVPGWHFYDDGLEILFGQTARRFHLSPEELLVRMKTLGDYLQLAARCQQPS